MARTELVVDPEYGDLWTGPAPIVRGTRFAPLTEIHLEVSCRDANGRLWKSANEYLVNADGYFDTSETAAVGEGYYGVAREGPFYSMLCQDGPGHDFALKRLGRIDYRFAAFLNKEEIWAQEHSRFLARSDTPPVRARAYLYDDGVLADEGETRMLLESYGIEVNPELPLPDSAPSGRLSLNYEKDSQTIPLFFVGSGRASAWALEAARTTRGASGVILFSGGGLRFEPKKSAHGQAVSTEPSYIELDHSSLQPKAEGILITRKLYAEAVADKKMRERGRIDVESINCPIYMFSGLDDQIWPASAFSELVAQRRKICGCSFPTYHRTFEGVGHDLGPSLGLPTLPTTERTIAHPDTGFRLLLGGKPGRQARARRECWDTLMQIFSGGTPV